MNETPVDAWWEKEKAYALAGTPQMIVFGFGLLGFFPDNGVTFKMPLVLGIALMILGGVGLYGLVRLRDLVDRPRGGGPLPTPDVTY